MSARLFACVRWLVIVPAHTILAASNRLRPPSPGVEQSPPVEAYDEL